ncbi:MAG: hypothetical protein KME67_11275 [Candidatus Thiodiazotropha sp. (ex Codakia orbicularis)]|nr:hypothetical protein [Candidatus Thiodiazotropha sp. (ex Codakia orbicularis)]MCG7860920.1 hypothetical protein [Candidatus Thiodiazotropha endolucinida]
MDKDISESIDTIVLPVVKQSSLVFVVWLASIAGAIFTSGIPHFIFVILYYVLSVALYFMAVQFDEAMKSAGEQVSNNTKGAFWFVANIATALTIHYLFFWGNNAI